MPIFNCICLWSHNDRLLLNNDKRIGHYFYNLLDIVQLIGKDDGLVAWDKTIVELEINWTRIMPYKFVTDQIGGVIYFWPNTYAPAGPAGSLTYDCRGWTKDISPLWQS